MSNPEEDIIHEEESRENYRQGGEESVPKEEVKDEEENEKEKSNNSRQIHTHAKLTNPESVKNQSKKGEQPCFQIK